MYFLDLELAFMAFIHYSSQTLSELISDIFQILFSFVGWMGRLGWQTFQVDRYCTITHHTITMTTFEENISINPT